MVINPFVADIREDLLDVGRESIPTFEIHGDEHCGGISDGGRFRDEMDNLSLFPSL